MTRSRASTRQIGQFGRQIVGRRYATIPRAGFTLVELLVAIAIIGILIALLLPAVQQAREASRRIQCANHIKQIALASQSYESAHKKLPAAGTYASPDEALTYSYSYWRVDLKSGTNHSWIVALLPYIEEQALYDQFNLDMNIMQNSGDPQAQQPPMLLCPSDGARGRMFEALDQNNGTVKRFGKANYAAYSNPFHIDAWHYPAAIWLYGRKLKQIPDGTAETLAFAEIRNRDHERDQRGAWALPWSGTSLLSFDFHPGLYPQVQSDKNSKPGSYNPNKLSLGQTQYPNTRNADVLYECPEAASAQFDKLPCNDQFWGYISAAPRSRHPGGVNAAFLDGHVSFLPNDVDEYTMLYMVDISDGESINGRY